MESKGSHETKFKSPYAQEMAKKPVSVMLPKEIDAWVRSLPNRTEWLRAAIAAQYERDKEEQGECA